MGATDVAPPLRFTFAGGALARSPPGLAFPGKVELLDRKGLELDHALRLGVGGVGRLGLAWLRGGPALLGIAAGGALGRARLALGALRFLQAGARLDLDQFLGGAGGQVLGRLQPLPPDVATAVSQTQLQRLEHVRQLHRLAGPQGADGPGGVGDHQVRPVARDCLVQAQPGD